MKKLFVPISNRTNYSKIKPIISILKNSLDVRLILSSSIVLDSYGKPYEDIFHDKFSVEYSIDCLLRNDSLESMCKSFGISIIEHSGVYKNNKPDGVLVVGDRYDMFPSVLSAKMMNIPIFHIQGGERSGSIDDIVRDLITVCSTRHYVATGVAYKNVQKISHTPYVYDFGCPAVEYVSELPVGSVLDISTFHKRFSDGLFINSQDDYMLIVLHSNTDDKNDVDMEVVLNSVLSFNMKIVVIYPSLDSFSEKIIRTINKFKSKITCIRHMPVEDFTKLMAHCKCLVGNTSSGIREAASFGVPVINVGNRQKNRERNKNTIDSVCIETELNRWIQFQLDHGLYEKSNIYYKNNCSKNICEDILSVLC